MRYVNQSDVMGSVASVFASINLDPDTVTRSQAIDAYIKASNKHLNEAIARLCFELKAKGKPTDLIAIDLGISQRTVLRAIRNYAQKTHSKSPLVPARVEQFFDLTHLIH